MDWPIHEIARLSGLTSRALRHYDQIGLLEPSSVAAGGVRHYDEHALLKLQDILLFRRAGVPLKQIRAIVREQHEPVAALKDHLKVLKQSQLHLTELMNTVESTLSRLEKGEPLMADEMLQGFDNSQYEEEVVERWGQESYDKSQRTFESMSPEARAGHAAAGIAIAQEFASAWESGAAPADSEAQAIAARHYSWVAHFWTPGREAYAGMGAMYRDDPRFAEYYTKHVDGDSDEYLQFLSDAISHYSDENLT